MPREQETQPKTRNYCPLAEHYTECPLFRKKCDAINCEANPEVRKAKHAA